jgi:hypothetical protein
MDKPIAWMMKHEETKNISFFNDKYNADAFTKTNPDWVCIPLYTAPPKREWVGLTDEDLTQFTDEFYKGAVWAEAKLKDRNA